jgi:23S rRNA (guanine745-N1)-methyltransferase
LLADVVPFLRCPVCAASAPPASPLVEDASGVRCPRGHSFDRHRHGYLHLTAKPLPYAGDTAAMVAARAEFLRAGHYDFISDAILEAAATPAYPSPLILDAGAGTGHYLAALLGPRPDAVGLAIDVSPAAARVAARAHPRMGAVVCDAWQPLPVADGSVGLLVNAFAPRNGPEFHRVLHRDGALIVTAPTARHLGELAQPLGLLTVDPDKEARLVALEDHFTLAARVTRERVMALSGADAVRLVAMGPNAFHSRAANAADLPEPIMVTAEVTVGVYRPRR